MLLWDYFSLVICFLVEEFLHVFWSNQWVMLQTDQSVAKGIFSKLVNVDGHGEFEQANILSAQNVLTWAVTAQKDQLVYPALSALFLFSDPAVLWSFLWLWCQPPTSALWWRNCSASSPPAPPSSGLKLPAVYSMLLKGRWNAAEKTV